MGTEAGRSLHFFKGRITRLSFGTVRPSSPNQDFYWHIIVWPRRSASATEHWWITEMETGGILIRDRVPLCSNWKKALAVTWASEKFADYILGRHYELEMDHKSLVPLLGNKHLDSLPPRILWFSSIQLTCCPEHYFRKLNFRSVYRRSSGQMLDWAWGAPQIPAGWPSVFADTTTLSGRMTKQKEALDHSHSILEGETIILNLRWHRSLQRLYCDPWSSLKYCSWEDSWGSSREVLCLTPCNSVVSQGYQASDWDDWEVPGVC